MVNERGSGGFVQNRGTGQVLLINNILAGKGRPLSGPGSLSGNLIARWTGQGKLVPAQNVRGNLIAKRAGFRDPKNFDYSLVKGSPAIDAGVKPRAVGGENMAPIFEYRHPRKKIPRKQIRNLDIGAYEFGAP